MILWTPDPMNPSMNPWSYEPLILWTPDPMNPYGTNHYNGFVAGIS